MDNPDIIKRVPGYFTELTTILPYIEKAQRAIDRETGQRLNIFQLYLGSSETLLSRILRDLLDPAGPHGQGGLFLELFLKELAIEENLSGSPVRVACEVPTIHIEDDRRRIDIVIDCPEKILIGIENKPWANEQKDQLTAYATHIQSMGPYDCRRIVYLSGDGNDPESIDKRSWLDQGVTLPYNASSGNSLKHWLQQCTMYSKAEKVRLFLEDFKDFISSSFPEAARNGVEI